MTFAELEAPHRRHHAKRYYQTAFCCGSRYSRWTYRQDRTFTTGHTHCAHCKLELRWEERRGPARLGSMRHGCLAVMSTLIEPFTSRTVLASFESANPGQYSSLSNISKWLGELAKTGCLRVVKPGGHARPSWYARGEKFKAPKTPPPIPEDDEPQKLSPREQSWREFRSQIQIPVTD